MWDIFIPAGLVVQNTPLEGLRTMLQWDHILFFGASLLWLISLAADLHSAGLTRIWWSTWALVLLPLVFALGPGAAISAGWLVREELLIRRLSNAVAARKKA